MNGKKTVASFAVAICLLLHALGTSKADADLVGFGKNTPCTGPEATGECHADGTKSQSVLQKTARAAKLQKAVVDEDSNRGKVDARQDDGSHVPSSDEFDADADMDAGDQQGQEDVDATLGEEHDLAFAAMDLELDQEVAKKTTRVPGVHEAGFDDRVGEAAHEGGLVSADVDIKSTSLLEELGDAADHNRDVNEENVGEINTMKADDEEHNETAEAADSEDIVEQDKPNAAVVVQADIQSRQETRRQLPTWCTDRKKTSPTACIDHCYDLQAARAKAAASREMAWSIIGSVTGGAGDVLGAMPSRRGKSKQTPEELLQTGTREVASANATSKFVGLAMAGVAIAAEIGGAVSAREDAYADANSQNCEQLASVLAQRRFNVLDDKMDKVLDQTAALRGDVEKIKNMVGDVEEKLSKQLHDLQVGQNQLMATAERLNLLINQNALDAKTTEFLRCAGNIENTFSTVQGAMSDRETFSRGLQHIIKPPVTKFKAKAARSWSRRYDAWNKNLINLLDQVVLHALEGMNCMSVLLHTGELLNPYFSLGIRQKLRQEIRTFRQGWEVMDHIYNTSINIAKDIFGKDEILSVAMNALVQMRYILTAIPRTGYWEDYKVYSNQIKAAYQDALNIPHKFMGLVKEELKTAMPIFFPPPFWCRYAIKHNFGDGVSSSSTLWGSNIVIPNIENMINSKDEALPTLQGTVPLSCIPMNVQHPVIQYPYDLDGFFNPIAHVALRRVKDFGRPGLKVTAPDKGQMDLKALKIFVKERQTFMAAWTCRAMDIMAKADAINRITDCMRPGCKQCTMQTCLDAGTVACPRFPQGLGGHFENCSKWLPQCQR